MLRQDAAGTYRQVSAHGGSPLGMIVALYDTILRDFRRAIVAIEANDVPQRVAELNHAVRVIGHLEEILDHKRGADAAERFQRFYQVTRGMIVAANAQATKGALDSLVGLYTPVRQAWHDVEVTKRGTEPEAPIIPKVADAPRMLLPAGAMESAEASRKNWNA
ncbi:MAG TPA: flagellar export chaperone FliS [Pirellulales bacterium]|jgi:flagellar biosynthetic protein FliS|nr:flagellar export chaperone FliS [Pirellulales bacterium]